jgi:uncharacterized protein (TIGR02996 family)
MRAPQRTDYWRLLTAVLANPDADGPRLVLAGWLEGRDPARAEFIRVQVEEIASKTADHPHRADQAYRDRLRRRAAELWALHRAAWFPGFPFRGEVRRGFIESVTLHTGAFLPCAKGLFRAHPLRKVRLTNFGLPQHGPGGFLWEGRWLRDRLLGGRVFSGSGATFRFFDAVAGRTGGKTYVTQEEALADVFAACVPFGRREAGLAAD